MSETGRRMRDPAERASRYTQRYAVDVAPINQLVDESRAGRGSDDVPYVDPMCGGVRARLLPLAADPGPMAFGNAAASGMLSWDNDDPTAAEYAARLAAAGISWAEAVPWNASP